MQLTATQDIDSTLLELESLSERNPLEALTKADRLMSSDDGAKDKERSLLPSQRIALLICRGNALWRLSRYSDASATLREALFLLSSHTDRSLEMRARNLLGITYQQIAHYREALTQFTTALSLATDLNDADHLARILNNIGMTYYHLSQFETALSYHERALTIIETLNDPSMSAATLNNIGNLFSSQGNSDEAIKRFESALSLAESIGFDWGVILMNNQLANEWLKAKHPAKAKPFAEMAYAASKRHPNHVGLDYALANLGKIEFQLGDPLSALRYSKEALDVAIKTGKKANEMKAVFTLGELYHHFPSLSATPKQDAIKCYYDALNLATQTASKEYQYKSHLALSTLCEEAGQLSEAFTHFKAFHHLEREVLSEAADARLKNYQVLYEVAEAQKNAELERLRNVELAAALAQLKAANAFKTELLGIAAHDLKNPLQSISGFAQAIAESASLYDAQEHAEFIHRSSQRMAKLIHDLLETAAIDSGKLNLKQVPLSLSSVVAESIARVTPHAEQKRHTISFDSLITPTVLADTARLGDAIDNLLSNAIKYSPNGSTTTVRLLCHDDNPLMAQLVIADEGLGMSSEDLKNVFGRFQRLSARPTGGESSTGLGLSIVKSVIEAHGGTISVSSDGVGKGTTVTITLPIFSGSSVEFLQPQEGIFPASVSDSYYTPPLSRSFSASGPISVAIVEDNRDLLEALSTHLSHDSRFRLTGTFDSAEFALGLLDEAEVILMDIGLPGLSGIDAIQKLKLRFSNAKIVMLTVQDDDHNISRAIIAGADGYFTKDTPLPKLLDAIPEAVLGGMPMSSGVARKISEFYLRFKPDDSSPVVLTTREKEVLAELVNGYTIPKIGARLMISIDTVRNHLRHIYEKLHVHSRSEAIAAALKKGLI